MRAALRDFNFPEGHLCVALLARVDAFYVKLT
jgi:hypothetical protein